MSTLLRKCWACGEKTAVRFGTDGKGRLVEMVDPCACRRAQAVAPPVRALQPDETEADRRDLARRTGECMDCGAPVDGAVGKALRCATHKRAALRAADRRSHEAHREERNRKQAERWRTDAEHRARKMERRRELYRQRMENDPEYRERYRKRRQRETLLSSPSRTKYLASQRKANRRRRRKKLEYMKRYNVYPAGYAPACGACGDAIPWGGRGRPKKYHAWCDPHASAAARQRAWDAHQEEQGGREAV